MPLRFVIIARRLLFYWSILHKKDNELVKQVYMTQKLSPVKNDWCLTIAEDLKYLNINLSENEISMMKKAKFKTLVNQKVQECAISFLSDLKQKHSKSDGIKVSNSMQSYLISNELSCEEKQFLFSLRNSTTISIA